MFNSCGDKEVHTFPKSISSKVNAYSATEVRTRFLQCHGPARLPLLIGIFFRLTSVNHMKFTESCVMCTKKHHLLKNCYIIKE